MVSQLAVAQRRAALQLYVAQIVNFVVENLMASALFWFVPKNGSALEGRSMIMKA